jgi:flagellar hook-associated protein 2
MADGINFTGLGSGVDTASIVEQLMRLERLPIQQVELRKAREEARQKALGEISTRLASIRAAAEALRDPTFWAGAPRATSGDERSYTLSASATAAKATYQVQVTKLATPEVLQQTAQGSSYRFGATYAAPGVLADRTTLLTSLADSAGTALGLNAGTTVSLSGSQGGAALAATFAVTATSTLDDLRAFVAGNVLGATVSVASGGRLLIQNQAGTDFDTSGVALSTGGAAAAFDAAFAAGSATQVSAASGLGRVPSVPPTDELQIGIGTPPFAFRVAVSAGWDMRQVADAINAAKGPVTASVADGRLRLTGAETGAQNVITVTSSAGTNDLASALGLTRALAPSDAAVTIDGVIYPRPGETLPSNTVTGLLGGATLTLKATSDAATSATTDPSAVDGAEVERRVRALVDAYNATVDLINTKATEKPVKNPKTEVDRMKGVLFGSSTLNTIRAGLREAVGGIVGGLAPGKNLAANLGVSTGAIGTGVSQDTLVGRLTFDSSKLSAMLASDRQGVQDLLVADGPAAAGDGIAQRLFDLAKTYTTTGGLVESAVDGASKQVAQLQTRIEDMTRRLTSTEARLKAQFLAMERAMSQLNASRSSLSVAQLQPR